MKILTRARARLKAAVATAKARVTPIITRPGFFTFGGLKVLHIGAYVDQPGAVEAIKRAAKIVQVAARKDGRVTDAEIAAIVNRTWVILHAGESFKDGPVESVGMAKRYRRWPYLVIHFATEAKTAQLDSLLAEVWLNILELPSERLSEGNIGLAS